MSKLRRIFACLWGAKIGGQKNCYALWVQASWMFIYCASPNLCKGLFWIVLIMGDVNKAHAINKLPILRRNFACLFCYKNRRVVALHNYFRNKRASKMGSLFIASYLSNPSSNEFLITFFISTLACLEFTLVWGKDE